MTVPNASARHDYVADGSTSSFAYLFKISSKNDLEVLKDGVTLTVDIHYVVTEVGNVDGGAVLFTTTPASDALITILRNQTFEQSSVYTPNEQFPARRIENDIDKLVMIAQQLREALARSFKVAKQSTVVDPEVPDFANLNDKYLHVTNGILDWVSFVLAGTYVDPITTKGDVLVGDAAGLASRIAVGADGSVLTADSTQSNGLKWDDPALAEAAWLPGDIKMRAVDVVPTGWLACDGATYNIVDYAALFAVIGNEYGGDGITTFKVPDARGRAPLGNGTGSGLTARAIGDLVGVETHPLVTAELAAHSHGVTDPGHTHTIGNHNHHVTVPTTTHDFEDAFYDPPKVAGDAGATGDAKGWDTDASSGNTGAIATGVTIANAGSGTAHQNMQPSFVVKYIIKT